MEGLRPPITLGGRLMTGRPIIPGYDKIFPTPLLGLCLAAGIGWVGFRFGAPPEIHGPIAMTAGLMILTLGGPSLKRWRLTGTHTISLRSGCSYLVSPASRTRGLP